MSRPGRHHKTWAVPESRPTGDFVTCPACGKRAYRTKADARRNGRQLYPGVRLRAYRCGWWWHVTSQSAVKAAVWREWDAR